VKKLAAQGLTEKQIADALGICHDTLINKKKQYSEFAEAIKEGKALGIGSVTSELMKQIKAGNTTATIFYLKCRAGWKETTVLEMPQGKRLEEMTDEELLAIIEGRKL